MSASTSAPVSSLAGGSQDDEGVRTSASGSWLSRSARSTKSRSVSQPSPEVSPRNDDDGSETINCILKRMQEKKTGVTIKDRRYHFKTFKRCFLGSEAVTWLVENYPHLCSNRAAATDLGSFLVEEGFVSHVCGDHDFVDKKLFYVFENMQGALMNRSATKLAAGLSKRAKFREKKLIAASSSTTSSRERRASLVATPLTLGETRVSATTFNTTLLPISARGSVVDETSAQSDSSGSGSGSSSSSDVPSGERRQSLESGGATGNTGKLWKKLKVSSAAETMAAKKLQMRLVGVTLCPECMARPEFLERFLRLAHQKVGKAQRLVLDWAKWHEKTMPHAITRSQLGPLSNGNESAFFLSKPGQTDKLGRPFAIIFASRIHPDEVGHTSIGNMYTYIMEEMEKRLASEGRSEVVFICDFKGWHLKNADEKARVLVQRLLLKRYPMRTAMFYVINVPSTLTRFVGVANALFTNMGAVRVPKHPTHLLEYFESPSLPQRYGGEDNLVLPPSLNTLDLSGRRKVDHRSLMLKSGTRSDLHNAVAAASSQNMLKLIPSGDNLLAAPSTASSSPSAAAAASAASSASAATSSSSASDKKLRRSDPLIPESAERSGTVSNMLYRDTVMLWKTEDVVRWLSAVGFAQYSKSFTKNDVDGRELLRLSLYELKAELGVKSLGHRKIIYGMIQAIATSERPTTQSAGKSKKRISRRMARSLKVPIDLSPRSLLNTQPAATTTATSAEPITTTTTTATVKTDTPTGTPLDDTTPSTPPTSTPPTTDADPNAEADVKGTAGVGDVTPSFGAGAYVNGPAIVFPPQQPYVEDDSDEDDDDDEDDDEASGGGDGAAGSGGVGVRELTIEEITIDIGDGCLGKGAYGSVYLGVWRGVQVAVKKLHVISAARMMDDDNDGSSYPESIGTKELDEAIEEFKEEAVLMQLLSNHPNVVPFVGAVFSRDEMALVTQYCANGSLYDLFCKQHRMFPVRVLVKMLIDVAAGMWHLHKEDVIHRDLACRNILVDSDWRLRVGDFGLSRLKSKDYSDQPNVGPLRWMAPEAIESADYSDQSDSFSFGVVMWEIFTQSQPFHSLENMEVAVGVVRKGLRETFPSYTPTEITSLAADLWKQDPNERPLFEEIHYRLTKYLRKLDRDACLTDADAIRAPPIMSGELSLDGLASKSGTQVLGLLEESRGVALTSSVGSYSYASTDDTSLSAAEFAPRCAYSQPTFGDDSGSDSDGDATNSSDTLADVVGLVMRSDSSGSDLDSRGGDGDGSRKGSGVFSGMGAYDARPASGGYNVPDL
eukprot:TRINITY_DN2200_c0_g2_i1.p1 TRINITY_DN2200_c0_g2~~TRINITY_DN2200_c0_g2_i1.p1  ORF type:complete len:1289 (+),score=287.03 TRINITY_DN2200_c0_g2_i1:261-4127(+)